MQIKTNKWNNVKERNKFERNFCTVWHELWMPIIDRHPFVQNCLLNIYIYIQISLFAKFCIHISCHWLLGFRTHRVALRCFMPWVQFSLFIRSFLGASKREYAPWMNRSVALHCTLVGSIYLSYDGKWIWTTHISAKIGEGTSAALALTCKTDIKNYTCFDPNAFIGWKVNKENVLKFSPLHTNRQTGAYICKWINWTLDRIVKKDSKPSYYRNIYTTEKNGVLRSLNL